MKSFFTTILAGALACYAVGLKAEVVDGIKALVHDSAVTLVEVEALTVPAVETLQKQGTPEAEFQKKVAEAEHDNLEHLIKRQLILHEFKTFNVPETILDKDVDKRIEDIIHDRYYGERMRLIKTLQAEGITMEKFRQQIRDQFIEIALRQKNISSEIIISPHKVETYYLAHRDDYKLEDEIKLRLIVLTNSVDVPQPKKLAEDILSELNAGASFAEMATSYSIGSQRKEGGDWGWIERRVLRKELADVAFSLKPGEHSGVIEIPKSQGEECYLMMVEDKRSTHFKSLGEVRDDIEHNLKLEEMNRLEKQWIDRLKKKTFVKYL